MTIVTIIKKILSLIRPKNTKEPALLPPTPTEKEQVAKLRNKVTSLPPIDSSPKNNETHNKWVSRQKIIRDNILNRDPRNFLYWPEITATMYTEAPFLELEYLKKTSSWDTWGNALNESGVGNPKRYKKLPQAGGNIIHHAYHLSQLTEHFRLDLKKIACIFEFGGGYGSMARLCYQLGFRGTYIIFDLPEFTALQEYFLSSINIPLKISDSVSTGENSVIITSDINQLGKILESTHIDITVATWSVSECPIAMRDQFINLAKNSDYYLIGYQNIFGEINNLEYFKSFRQKLSEYEWTDYEIKHLKGNWYLLGGKQNE